MTRNAVPSGTQFDSPTLGKVTVGRLLGSGGQGAVYEATAGGSTHALKWYHTPGTSDQLSALKKLVEMTAPSKAFLWPKALVTKPGSAEFGYLMALRDPKLVEFTQLANGRARINDNRPPGPIRVQLLIALRLVEALRRLHMQGYVYKDLNLGGPFVDLTSGAVMICDCDNVVPNETKGTIFFPEFAAPEVVLGATPTIVSDRHSVAVLLFYLFARGNPYDGQRGASINIFTDLAKRDLYGERPVFVYHPTDRSNLPVKGIHDSLIKNWSRLPSELKQMFTKVFVEGAKNPKERPSLDAWHDVLRTQYDRLVKCASPTCGGEHFGPAPGGSVTQAECCWCNVRRQVDMVSRFELSTGRQVYLTPHIELLGDHVGDPWDFDTVMAKLVDAPQSPGKMGLRNDSKSPWKVTLTDGAEVEIAPGKAVIPARGMKIAFRSSKREVTAEIK
jgi:DNA-binding helix-hairpin-helix protein with protein kinase domain